MAKLLEVSGVRESPRERLRVKRASRAFTEATGLIFASGLEGSAAVSSLREASKANLRRKPNADSDPALDILDQDDADLTGVTGGKTNQLDDEEADSDDSDALLGDTDDDEDQDDADDDLDEDELAASLDSAMGVGDDDDSDDPMLAMPDEDEEDDETMPQAKSRASRKMTKTLARSREAAAERAAVASYMRKAGMMVRGR